MNTKRDSELIDKSASALGEGSIGSIKALIRDVPNFPKPGILFKDITPVLSNPQAFQGLIGHLCGLVPSHTTVLGAIESRGFILGAAMAVRLGLGVVLVRKPGKLPYATLTHTYDNEYAKDTLQIHVDALNGKDRVCIIDDVLATGGTAGAAETLALETGATVTGFAFFMELGALGGRARLKAPAQSLLSL